MSREIRFTATDEEYAEISAYVDGKKRWRKMSYFVRDACFQLIARNPLDRHGAVLHQRSGGKEGEGL